jgi:uncharacterized protein YggE
MRKLCLVGSALVLFSLVAPAQPPRRSFIGAFGEATVSVKPDQAKIQFSVVTQAASAQDAANQNASQVTALLTALSSVLGPNADIKTLSYSLSPNYNYPPGGGQPILLGYTASNTVLVTMSDLSLIGKVIDTGIQAGGNRVQGLQFGLKDDQPIRLQALKLATVQAKAHADAMASGLNLRTGAPISIQEGAFVNIQPVNRLGTATPNVQTPIETGVVDVRATVTLEIEIAQ